MGQETRALIYQEMESLRVKVGEEYCFVLVQEDKAGEIYAKMVGGLPSGNIVRILTAQESEFIDKIRDGSQFTFDVPEFHPVATYSVT